MEAMAPVEILFRGEWTDPHQVLDRNAAAALEGLTVAARVPAGYTSVPVGSDKIKVPGSVALVEGKRFRVRGRDRHEREDGSINYTFALESEDGGVGMSYGFD